LYYYNARFYDPSIGRFITADSIIDDPEDTQGWNRYSYCGNNPIVYIDPTGHLRVYIWTYHGSIESAKDGQGKVWGHAMIVLDDGTPISWWPQIENRETLLDLPIPIYSVDAIPNQDLQDVEGPDFEDSLPDFELLIRGLDEKAIKDWWENDWKTDPKWETLTRNCSTTAAKALKAGGGDKYSSFKDSFNLIWTPADVQNYALSIVKEIERQNYTPSTGINTTSAYPHSLPVNNYSAPSITEGHENPATVDHTEGIYNDNSDLSGGGNNEW
jgi:hypothetical protein